MTDTPTAERDLVERLRKLEADIFALTAGKIITGKFATEMAETVVATQTEIRHHRMQIDGLAAEITRLRSGLEQARERLMRDRLLTIMSDSAAQVDRARPADERDGPAWNGPGGDWWELFEETVSAQLEPGTPGFRAALSSSPGERAPKSSEADHG